MKEFKKSLKYYGLILFMFLLVPRMDYSMNEPFKSINTAVLKKVDPLLRQLLLAGEQSHFLRNNQSTNNLGDNRLDVFISMKNAHELLDIKGVHIRSEIGNIITADVSFSSIIELIHHSGLEKIALARICFPTLDLSIPEIGADKIWQGIGGKGYEGEGVIIGIYDSGIDWAHRDFMDIYDSTRILVIWDQTDESGPAPADFGYGTEYTQDQINNELFRKNVEVVHEKDTWGHGTHVAGIAAGGGLATGNGQPSETYRGVAPRADLMVIKGFDQGDGIFDTRVVDGVNFLFQRAQELNRSLVVNLSIGRRDGPHDGSSWFEKSLTNLYFTPGGIQKGRAIVASAGNDGERGIHAIVHFDSVAKNESVEIEFHVNNNPTSSTDFILMEGWFPGISEPEITIKTPEGEQIGPVFPGVVMGYPSIDLSMVYIDHAVGGIQSNGDKRIYISINDVEHDGQTQHFASGTWKLSFSEGSGRLDLWIYETTVDVQITKGVDFSTMIVEPGNGPFIITVGSYISRISWPSLDGNVQEPGDLVNGQLSKFTNPGPTRPNTKDPLPANKPEVVAPGEYILSSLSADMNNRPADTFIAPDGVHFALNGTSMATGHISGLIGLMFEANPELTVSEIASHLILTARKDPSMGDESWTPYWGYGKVNGPEVILKTSVQSTNDPLISQSFFHVQNDPNPFNSKTMINYQLPMTSEVQLDIYNLMGEKVITLVSKKQPMGIYKVEWDGKNDQGKQVSSGVYIYQLKVGSNIQKHKMILMR